MTLKHVYVAGLVLILAHMASAQTAATASGIRSSKDIENSCKIKAKEIAAETYRGCVSEQKNAQIDQIKKEYSAKLQALKAHYDSELKKMAGAKAEAKAAEAKPAAAAAKTAEADESTMDIPEPIPVESAGM